MRQALLAAGILLTASAVWAAECKLTDSTVVVFAEAAEGKRLITERDEFIRRMSPFDRKARMHQSGDVSEQVFVDFLSKQVLDWSPREIELLTRTLESVRKKLAPFDVSLPEKVYLVKTSGLEEGNAAYTRGAAVFLPQGECRTAAGLEKTLTHELFHVFMRHAPKRRDAFYRIIGFEPANEIKLPDAFDAARITNPDGPRNDHVITLAHIGKPVTVVPILLADVRHYEPRQRRPFFDYLVLAFMEVEKHDGAWRPKLEDARPVLLGPGDLDGLVDKIGANTDYIIHPEEILADNFSLLVRGETRVPTPRILDEMRKLLAK